MKLFVVCLLLVLSAILIQAAPLKDQQQTLLQTGNSTQHPEAAQETLRSVVGPLMSDVNSRIERVDALEAAETSPIIHAISTLTASLSELEVKAQEVNDRSEAIPGQVSEFISQRDEAKKTGSELTLSLKAIKADGESRLTTLDQSNDVAAKDEKILKNLVEFVEQQIGSWDSTSNFAQVSAALSSLSSQPPPLQGNDPQTIVEYLHSLLEGVEKTQVELSRAITNLTTTLSQQTTSMEGRIEAASRMFDTAVSQLEALEQERHDLFERAAMIQGEKSGNEEAKKARELELSKAQAFWNVERAQLIAIRETAEQILLVLQP